MRLGLLICDESKSAIDHPCGSYLNMFQKLFSEFKEVELVGFDLCQGEYPMDPTEFDGFVSTGSSVSVYDDLEWIQRFEEFLRKLYQLEIKYFGVCFGHQMLARALGGEVGKANQGWMVGVKSVEVHSAQDWMGPNIQTSAENKTKVNIISSHQDQVITLPKGGFPIASSLDCPIAMFGVGDNLVGIQGHPEFQREYAQPLLESRREMIGDIIVDPAIQSYEESLDSREIACWIVNFMK